MKCYSLLLLAMWTYAFYSMGVNQSFWACFFAGFCLTNLIGLSHNYLHQPKSIWHYLINVSTITEDEWHISHNLSHHSYNNTELDVEITSFEPYVFFLSS